MKQSKFKLILAILSGIVLLLTVSACGDNSTNINDEQSISQDAAESIAGDIAYNTGGTIDQLMDLSAFATNEGIEGLQQKYPATHFTIQKTYDAVAGEWTIHIERERGISGFVPYAFVSRDYVLQYLNSEGTPQQHYVAGADTARTINFEIVQGYGRHITRRLSQQLNELNAAWIVTNANLDVITVNGTYNRAAVDTIRTWSRVRTSDHDLQLNIEDLTLPRGSTHTLVNALSGHITGHFHADITFTSGASYSENTIDRDIDILIGSGLADIAIDDKTYHADILTGELQD